jgi:hypothetical protein
MKPSQQAPPPPAHRARPAPQQAMVEAEEEFITNKLMKRLEQLKKEKQVLANEVRGAAGEMRAHPHTPRRAARRAIGKPRR